MIPFFEFNLIQKVKWTTKKFVLKQQLYINQQKFNHCDIRIKKVLTVSRKDTKLHLEFGYNYFTFQCDIINELSTQISIFLLGFLRSYVSNFLNQFLCCSSSLKKTGHNSLGSANRRIRQFCVICISDRQRMIRTFVR